MLPALIAMPIFNEERHLEKVLREVRAATPADILVINDGSTDSTAAILARHRDVQVCHHARNQGYGQSLIDAFHWAAQRDYEWVITMDCDEQHEPAMLPEFLAAAARDHADIISGSRYLNHAPGADVPPPDRRQINREITALLNRRLELNLTDSFCGFKAHRVSAMQRLCLTEPGYAFPMQLWVEAVRCRLRIVEIPVRLIYTDPNRHFGGVLDDPKRRLRHYLRVFEEALAAAELARAGAAPRRVIGRPGRRQAGRWRCRVVARCQDPCH